MLECKENFEERQMMFLDKFKSTKNTLKNKSKFSGATLIEYALILSLIGVVLIGSYKKLGGSYSDIYKKISEDVAEAGTNS